MYCYNCERGLTASEVYIGPAPARTVTYLFLNGSTKTSITINYYQLP